MRQAIIALQHVAYPEPALTGERDCLLCTCDDMPAVNHADFGPCYVLCGIAAALGAFNVPEQARPNGVVSQELGRLGVIDGKVVELDVIRQPKTQFLRRKMSLAEFDVVSGLPSRPRSMFGST